MALHRLRRLAQHLGLSPDAGSVPAPAAASTTGAAASPPTPLGAEVCAAFDRDGFVNGGELLAPDEVAELSAALDELIARGPEGFGAADPAPMSFRSFSGSADIETRPNWQIMNCWEAHPAFQRLIYHPNVVGATAQLCRTTSLAVWHDQVQYKPPEHGGATAWQ